MLHQRHEATPLPKVIRETQAEAVTYVVSHAVGLETNNAAADYITLYNGDKKTLADSLAAIQETSSKILDELFPEKSMPSLEQRAEGLNAGRESDLPADRTSHAENLSPGSQVTWDRYYHES